MNLPDNHPDPVTSNGGADPVWETIEAGVGGTHKPVRIPYMMHLRRGSHELPRNGVSVGLHHRHPGPNRANRGPKPGISRRTTARQQAKPVRIRPVSPNARLCSYHPGPDGPRPENAMLLFTYYPHYPNAQALTSSSTLCPER